MTMGRPPMYTPELAEAVCEAIAEGQTVRTIEKTPGMPSWATIRKWLLTKDDFATHYARAYEASAATHEGEAFDLIRAAKTPEEAACARVFLDAVKWSNGKRNPKVYGDKITQQHTGADGGAIQIEDARAPIASLIAGVLPK